MPWAIARLIELQSAAEEYMKVYLLMLLIGTLLTAIRFTTVTERKSEAQTQ
jgi:hypothetical protein